MHLCMKSALNCRRSATAQKTYNQSTLNLYTHTHTRKPTSLHLAHFAKHLANSMACTVCMVQPLIFQTKQIAGCRRFKCGSSNLAVVARNSRTSTNKSLGRAIQVTGQSRLVLAKELLFQQQQPVASSVKCRDSCLHLHCQVRHLIHCLAIHLPKASFARA